jgi:hypothetical protein
VVVVGVGVVVVVVVGVAVVVLVVVVGLQHSYASISCQFPTLGLSLLRINDPLITLPVPSYLTYALFIRLLLAIISYFYTRSVVVVVVVGVGVVVVVVVGVGVVVLVVVVGLQHS